MGRVAWLRAWLLPEKATPYAEIPAAKSLLMMLGQFLPAKKAAAVSNAIL